MLILIVSALWLGILVLVAAMCRMAARGDHVAVARDDRDDPELLPEGFRAAWDAAMRGGGESVPCARLPAELRGRVVRARAGPSAG